MTTRKGFFAPEAIPSGWWDETTQAIGWFSDDLLTEDAPPQFGRDLAADSGSYVVTGTAADLELGRRVAADAGSYVVTGADAALTLGSAQTLIAEAGAYAVTGSAADLEYGRRVAADAGAYTVTGADAALSRGTALAAEAGSYAVAGGDVAFLRTYALAATGGAYSVTGAAAALLYSEETPEPEAPRRLAGGGTIRRSRSVRASYVGEEPEDEKQPEIGPVEFERSKVPAPVKAPSPEAVETVAGAMTPKPIKVRLHEKPAEKPDPINRAVAANDDDFLQFAMIVWASR